VGFGVLSQYYMEVKKQEGLSHKWHLGDWRKIADGNGLVTMVQAFTCKFSKGRVWWIAYTSYTVQCGPITLQYFVT